ncbi:DUF6507 family protein [Streptomyces sp. NPDC015144]|uniref:DUF6507 family protein n=1 Tax=Streptomyces sp. NPDC015144 TaxID=3364944 RepID=UPI0036FFAADF
MTGWDLKPQGIRAVLKTTGEVVAGGLTYATPFGGHLSSVAAVDMDPKKPGVQER